MPAGPSRFSSRARLVALAGVLAVLAPRQAAARETFPQLVQKALNAACTPSCLPCHTEVPGTKANRRNDGLAAALLTQNAGHVYDEDIDRLLKGMLDGTLMPPADSNNDGENDLIDVQGGVNPYDGKTMCDSPRYGCGASVARRGPTELGALAFALVSGAVVLRRRRRRHTQARLGVSRQEGHRQTELAKRQ